MTRCLLLGFSAPEAAALAAAVTARRPGAVVGAMSTARLSHLQPADRDAVFGHAGLAVVVKVDSLASAAPAVTCVRAVVEGRLRSVALLTEIPLRPLLQYMDTWERLRFDELRSARRISIAPNHTALYAQIADDIIYALEGDPQ